MGCVLVLVLVSVRVDDVLGAHTGDHSPGDAPRIAWPARQKNTDQACRQGVVWYG